ncbi:MAG TPA: hypothetical protein VN222_07840 [Novosphingobium sp.]|nr:hypothetical protein [Novosphingobium sp.]
MSFAQADVRLADDARDRAIAQEERGNIAVSLEKLAVFRGSGIHWREVAAQYEGMEGRGLLSPADRVWRDRAREHARAEGENKP